MISGRVALGGLSLEFGDAQKRFDALADRVRELSERQASLVKEERGLIEELAGLYLPELSPEAVSAGLRALESRMMEALEEQRAHGERLAAQLADLPNRILALTRAVTESEAAEALVAARLDEIREAVERDLGADEAYRAAVDEHDAVMERRALLKDRRARLQAAANVERPRYEAHPPFVYLKKRSFGEPEYRGGALGRLFDGWLARRTDFREMARKHRILQTGPHAIQAEIRRLTKRGEELEAVLDERQAMASGQNGLHEALAAEAAAQRRLVADRAALEEATSRRDVLAAEAREVQAHRGGPYREAVEQHRDFLESQTVRELLEIARATPDPRDDALVGKVERVRSQLEGVSEELAAQRKELDRLAGRTNSLADLARSAAAGFSSRRSYFPEGFRFSDIVSSLLDGDRDTDEALQAIQDAHIRKHVLAPSREGPWQGWFAELSSDFDQELGATRVEVVDGTEMESEVVVRDVNGRVIHRRVTRTKSSGS